MVSDLNSIPEPKLEVAVPVVLFTRIRFLVGEFAVAVLDDTVKYVPSNVKLFSATAAFDVPSDVNTLLSAAVETVVNPVPDVPDEPLVPLEPDVPDVPAAPDVPEEPLVPDEPDVPEEPEVPEVPAAPAAPEVQIGRAHV